MDEEEEEKEMIDSRLSRKKGKTKQTPRLTSLKPKKKTKKRRRLHVDHWSQRASKSANLNDRAGFIPSAQVYSESLLSYLLNGLDNHAESQESAKP